MRGPVVVMDSGVGGLPYLEAARLLLPHTRFVYLADREGFPYGTKPRSEVVTIVRDRVSRLVAGYQPSAIVIACNTASQAALQAIRQDHPKLPVIGTVPAIKPAAERTVAGIIGVLATECTVGDPYLDDLILRFAAGRTVIRRAAQDLVSFVEFDFPGSTAEGRKKAVLPHVLPLIEAGVDEIVLACTHFLHVALDISLAAREVSARELGRMVEVVDSRDGVARRLQSLLGDADRESQGIEPSLFLVSGPPPFEQRYSEFARLYGLAGPQSLSGSA
ncbi:MAG: glutamate racemase [Spirochaetota bacterium]